MLGHVIIGDVAATLVDLAGRQVLNVAENGGDWVVTPSAPGPRAELLGYEEILLGGVSAAGGRPLSALAGEFAPVLDKVRSAVVHDAVHHGWLKHLHHQERTTAGEDLAHEIRAFQRGLMHLKEQGGAEALAGPLLPYALHFGMIDGDGLPLARFAHAWVATFHDLPGWGQPVHEHTDLAERDLHDYKVAPNAALGGRHGAWLSQF
jgi:hypothetical protein